MGWSCEGNTGAAPVNLCSRGSLKNQFQRCIQRQIQRKQLCHVLTRPCTQLQRYWVALSINTGSSFRKINPQIIQTCLPYKPSSWDINSSPFDLNCFVILWFHIWGNTDFWPYSEMSLRDRHILSLLACSCSAFNILITALVRAVTTWSTVRQQRSVYTWVCHWLSESHLWAGVMKFLHVVNSVMTAECVIWFSDFKDGFGHWKIRAMRDRVLFLTPGL